MLIVTDLSQVKPQPSCLSIGFFDGVHRGHRHLIDQASAAARTKGLQAVVVTFYPHPRVVLRGAEPIHLSTREEKLALLSTLDLDLIVIQPFTPGLARTSASQYVHQLIHQIGMVELWIGPDFALGYGREGNVDFLRRMGPERDFDVNVVNRLELDELPISSSRIRQALSDGDVAFAARCLGRPFSLQGLVVIGAQRGRTIGFPTANIAVSAEQAVPANGVYAAWARVVGHPVQNPDSNEVPWHVSSKQGTQDEIKYCAVVNIGTRPTFDDGPRTIEAHLLDFNRSIYGDRLTLDFAVRMRPEQQFDGAGALEAQINSDVAHARQLLTRA